MRNAPTAPRMTTRTTEREAIVTDEQLAALHPSTLAVRSLLRSASSEAIDHIACADSGWGEDETRETLALLSAEDRFDGPIEWQVVENLQLCAWAGREQSPRHDVRLDPHLLHARALSCAVLVRGSGDPVNRTDWFFALHNPVVQLVSSSVVCAVPTVEETRSLFAWRLGRPRFALEEEDMALLRVALLILCARDATGPLAPELRAPLARSAAESLDRVIGDADVAAWFDALQLGDRWRFWLAGGRGVAGASVAPALLLGGRYDALARA